MFKWECSNPLLARKYVSTSGHSGNAENLTCLPAASPVPGMQHVALTDDLFLASFHAANALHLDRIRKKVQVQMNLYGEIERLKAKLKDKRLLNIREEAGNVTLVEKELDVESALIEDADSGTVTAQPSLTPNISTGLLEDLAQSTEEQPVAQVAQSVEHFKAKCVKFEAELNLLRKDMHAITSEKADLEKALKLHNDKLAEANNTIRLLHKDIDLLQCNKESVTSASSRFLLSNASSRSANNMLNSSYNRSDSTQVLFRTVNGTDSDDEDELIVFGCDEQNSGCETGHENKRPGSKPQLQYKRTSCKRSIASLLAEPKALQVRRTRGHLSCCNHSLYSLPDMSREKSEYALQISKNLYRIFQKGSSAKLKSWQGFIYHTRLDRHASVIYREMLRHGFGEAFYLSVRAKWITLQLRDSVKKSARSNVAKAAATTHSSALELELAPGSSSQKSDSESTPVSVQVRVIIPRIENNSVTLKNSEQLPIHGATSIN